MKPFRIVWCLSIVIIIFSSCYKDYSIEGNFQSIPSNVSSGVLGNALGNCEPAILSGIYAKDITLDSSNTVQLQVAVSIPGSYTITSDTINGVYFSSVGNFSATGTYSITLQGFGKPSATGQENFTVTYGSSQCNFQVTFVQAANGSLGSGGNCTSFSIFGIYQQGTILNSTNTVQVEVNVTTAGSYKIVTNTVNGVYFSASGIFTNTGIQTINLTGNGIPLNSGLQNFNVTFGNSVCNFSISFSPAAMSSNDYFPLTANSNWTFEKEGGTSLDSIHTAIISYTPVFSGNAYNTIVLYQEPFNGNADDSSYYRKPGNGDYYQYYNYSHAIPFDQTVVGEFIFLKDYVSAGTSWTSSTVSGKISGISTSAYFKITILEKGVLANVGSFSFPDVIKVKYELFISGDQSPLSVDERWFAKNVGEVYDNYNDLSLNGAYDIAAYQVF